MFGKRSGASGKSAVESSTIAVFAVRQVHAASPSSRAPAGSRPRSRPAPGPCAGRRRRRPSSSASSSRGLADAVRQTTATSGTPRGRASVASTPSMPGQPVVHHDHVRLELAARRRRRARAVVDRADDLEPVLEPEQELERCAEDIVVLDEQDADRRAGPPPRHVTRSPLGGEQQRVVRLPAVLDVELDAPDAAPAGARGARRAPARPRR